MVIVGDYDSVKQPIVVDNRFDYILFTDIIKEKTVGVWRVQPIDYITDKNYLKARYPRLNPEIVLPEYDAWLYHDGTMQIASQWVYDRFIELYNNGIDWACNKHQYRTNVYEEISAITLEPSKQLSDIQTVNWYWYMRNTGYPDEHHLPINYLYESGIIFRRHSDVVKRVNEIWWNSLEKYNVQRDQFSLMYALWKVSEVRMCFFLKENEDVWHNAGRFIYTKHIQARQVMHMSKREKARRRCWRSAHGTNELYTHLYDQAYAISPKHPKLALELWTIYAVIRYGYKVIWEMIKCRI